MLNREHAFYATNEWREPPNGPAARNGGGILQSASCEAGSPRLRRLWSYGT